MSALQDTDWQGFTLVNDVWREVRYALGSVHELVQRVEEHDAALAQIREWGASFVPDDAPLGQGQIRDIAIIQSVTVHGGPVGVVPARPRLR